MEFYHEIAKYYDYIFPLKEAQVKFVLKDKNENQKILDVGCAVGKLSEALSHKNHVVGIDLDDKMIDIAKQLENDNLTFYCMSMLDISDCFDHNSFDQILCFGNTLVHLNDINQVKTFFENAFSLLKENGKLKMQIINYDKVINDNITSLPTIENDKIKFTRLYEQESGKINFKTELLVKSTKNEYKNSIKLLPLLRDEVLELAKDIGFKEIFFYSGFNKVEYDNAKLPLVFEIRK